MNIKSQIIGSLFVAMVVTGCANKINYSKPNKDFDVDAELAYCAKQSESAIKLIPNEGNIPRSIATNTQKWNYVDYKDWTSGFWPGELWYLYEFTGDRKWEESADKFTQYLMPLSINPAVDHDLGFQVFNSYGNGYRLTRNPEYKEVILKTADTLATLFNPKVGTILSWPRAVPNMEWPQHNTIMDNMINLELLFWASKNGSNKALYDMAVSHATVTMQNHFRPDYTSYHVVVYDKKTGKKIKATTHQGYSDSSMWARGQAWAIYGYTMVYRETKDLKFLDFAQKVSRVYLDRLPQDLIPYWDFDDPAIPNTPKDASAAAVVASALLELSTYTSDPVLKKEYFDKAENMLKELSENYQSKDKNSACLLHSTGHKPAGSEIDYSIIYADYYYVEALLRYKKLLQGESLLSYKND
ncbi:glucuronyl hydrolase [Flavobacterium cheongpyeongense]|jgi:unsaturated chondroitin disaccharide hydrolase|uniref:Glucuronyl hydrolase n=1 Tax=Flavobacterium cheongpyeongense TaxID=2212651 RepID=A0A2V4BJR2_9FLAO|nr:glycoside hydrolase family 88 protein [Flavobacterium cheongpyeongense]PXY39218.1 glucuronyl hydrolase [Flavobacterium cheongpyeongense]